MKNISLIKYLVPVVALWALGASEMYGAGGSWNVDAGGNWSDDSNWDPVAIPGGGGSVVNLTYDITATRIVTIDTTPRTVGILNIGDFDTSNLFTLAASGGGYLILDNDGSAAQINMGAGGSVNGNVITAPLRLTTHGVVINNNAGTNRIITGAISTDTLGLKLITVNSSGGNIALSGIISDGSGQIGILHNASGVEVGFYNGNNTFSGGITVQRGSIRAGNNNGFGTGTVTLGNASSGSSTIAIASTGARTTANNIVVSSDASSANISISTNDSNGVTIKYTGNIELQRKIEFNTASGNSKLEFSGKIFGDGNLDIKNTGANLTTAAVVLSGDNSGLTGNIETGNNVYLALGHTNALGSDNTVTLGGTNLRLSSVVSNLVVNSNSAIVSTANFAFIGDYDMTIKNDVSLTSNRTIDVASGRTLGLGGIVSGGFSLVKEGTGTLVLDGANTYSSDTQVNSGVLQGSGSVAGNVYIADGATLSNAGGEFTVGGGDLGFEDGAIFHFTLDTTTALAAKIISSSVTLDDDVVFSFQETGSTHLTEGTIFTPFDATTFTGTFAGLSEGDVVSGGVNSYKISYLGGGFTLEVIPEPGTLALLALGGLVALAFRRRRQ